VRHTISPAYTDGFEAGLRTGRYAEYQTLSIKPRVPYETETEEEADWLAGFAEGSKVWEQQKNAT
jgi:hypothetical protein